jgi:hypothetical protein
MNPASYDLKVEEIKGPLDFITPCYLVVHPKGTLPDANMPAERTRISGSVPGKSKVITAIGCTGLCTGQYHVFGDVALPWDLSANANEFVRSTWLVQESERAAMFSDPPPPLVSVAHTTRPCTRN